jgi:phosphoribosyl-AMP cyclohydrolase
MHQIDHLIEPLLARLRREQPNAVAILCHGSYARGAAEAHSDLDLDVLIDGEEDCYQSAFEELPDGRLLHITIGTQSLASWLAHFDEAAESEEWAFFLPARQVARLLWATPQVQAQLEQRLDMEWEAAPQLQDLIECAAKVRNAALRGDEIGVRLAAQQLALRCPALVALFNPPVRVATPRDALQAALDFAVAPPGYRDGLLVCMGLSGQATSAQQVHDTALHLASGIIEMLQVQPELAEDHIEDGLAEALDDGSVVRLLRQE